MIAQGYNVGRLTNIWILGDFVRGLLQRINVDVSKPTVCFTDSGKKFSAAFEIGSLQETD